MGTQNSRGLQCHHVVHCSLIWVNRHRCRLPWLGTTNRWYVMLIDGNLRSWGQEVTKAAQRSAPSNLEGPPPKRQSQAAFQSSIPAPMAGFVGRLGALSVERRDVVRLGSYDASKRLAHVSSKHSAWCPGLSWTQPLADQTLRRTHHDGRGAKLAAVRDKPGGLRSLEEFGVDFGVATTEAEYNGALNHGGQAASVHAQVQCTLQARSRES